MNILVTGGSGKLGQHLVPILKKNNYVTSPSHTEFDITQDTVTRFHGINTVVHLAGATDVAGAEKDGSIVEVNLDADWLTGFTGKIYHLSTDYVYDGNVINSKETDRPSPFNVYGYSKAAMEILLQMRCVFGLFSQPVIIRTSFKPIQWPHPVAFDDMYTNADTVDVIAKMIAEFIELDPPAGIWNIGTERKSVYELVKRNNPEVKSGSVKSVPYLRPEVTMDLTKYHNFLEEKCVL